MDSTANATLSRRLLAFIALDRVTLLGLFIVLASLFAKTWQVLRYPTIPVSDFQQLVEFANVFSEQGPLGRTWQWTLAAPGAPMLMSVPLALLDGNDFTISRWFTMFAMAALPLLPLVMLRDLVPGWARVLATALIALLPAQTVFASVPAQDTWVQWPVVALACLAIRNARGTGRGAPAWAALLYGWSLYTRPEMLLAALPLAVLAAWPMRETGRWMRSAAWFIALSMVLVGGIVAQRGLSTGHYALTSPHGGASMLGAYVPGVGFGWTQPESWVATFDPEMANDPSKMMERAGRVAWREIERRPLFHLQRRLGALLYAGTGSDGTITYWTLMDTAQQPENAQGANAYAARVDPLVRWGFVALHALFAGALVVAGRRRDSVLLALILAIAIKLGLHLLFASQARFFLVISSLEALAIAMAAVELANDRGLRRWACVGVAAGGLIVGGGMLALPAWQAALDDPAPRLTQRFILRGDIVQGSCELVRGKLLYQSASTFGFQVENADPAPAELARVGCMLEAVGEGGAFTIEVQDRYEPGGFPDRLAQEAFVNDTRVLYHDIAADPGKGWWSHLLRIRKGQRIQVTVQVVAIRPDAGPAWGNAAATDVRIVQRGQ